MSLHVCLSVALTFAGLTTASMGTASATNMILDSEFGNYAPKSQVGDGLSSTADIFSDRNGDSQQGEAFSSYQPANGDAGGFTSSLTPTIPANGEHVTLDGPGGFTQAISGLAAWAQNKR